MEFMEQRAWAEVDLDRLAHNFEFLRRQIPAPVKIMSVVKANAYSCGDLPVSARLAAAGTDWFGVATVEEAVRVRAAAPHTPILIFGATPDEAFPLLWHHRLTQTVFSPGYARALDAAAVQAGQRVEVHLNLNTGMNRLGFDCCTEPDRDRALDQCRQVFALRGLRVTGCYTHLPSAYGFDADDVAFTRAQLALFCRMTDALTAAGCPVGLRHCATSAICLNDPAFALDMVRPGAALYGAIPDECYLQKPDFAPVLSLKASVIQLRWLEKGQPVSYDRTYRAPGRRRIAVLSAGFADGVQRRLAGKGHVLIRGRACPVVGTVCMDLVMADVTDAGGVCCGDTATFIGEDGAQSISFNDWEEQLGCGLTEAMCSISARPRRLYRTGGTLYPADRLPKYGR